MKSVVTVKKLFFALTFILLKLVSQIISRELELGPCFLQYFERCDNDSIQFFLFSSDRPANPPVQLDNTAPKLNPSDFVNKSFKMIIHGYGGHLDFNGSKLIRNGKASKLLGLAVTKLAACCETTSDIHSHSCMLALRLKRHVAALAALSQIREKISGER